jgi:hypothetical protein
MAPQDMRTDLRCRCNDQGPIMVNLRRRFAERGERGGEANVGAALRHGERDCEIEGEVLRCKRERWVPGKKRPGWSAGHVIKYQDLGGVGASVLARCETLTQWEGQLSALGGGARDPSRPSRALPADHAPSPFSPRAYSLRRSSPRHPFSGTVACINPNRHHHAHDPVGASFLCALGAALVVPKVPWSRWPRLRNLRP